MSATWDELIRDLRPEPTCPPGCDRGAYHELERYAGDCDWYRHEQTIARGDGWAVSVSWCQMFGPESDPGDTPAVFVEGLPESMTPAVAQRVSEAMAWAASICAGWCQSTR